MRSRASSRTYMFTKRSNKKELLDNLTLADAAVSENLKELEAVNHWLGGKTTLISALDKVYEKHSSLFSTRTISIADLGCGGGDLLRAIHDWAKAKRVNV